LPDMLRRPPAVNTNFAPARRFGSVEARFDLRKFHSLPSLRPPDPTVKVDLNAILPPDRAIP